MAPAPSAVLGLVYRCPLCGAELVVIRPGEGALAPECCNRPMDVREGSARLFRCPICGAEVAVIREGGGKLEPECCNVSMESML